MNFFSTSGKTVSSTLVLSVLSLLAASLAPAKAAEAEPVKAAEMATESVALNPAANFHAPVQESNQLASQTRELRSLEIAQLSDQAIAVTESAALPPQDSLEDLEANTGVSQLSAADDDSESPTMSQVTSVSQLNDVSPSDWAFQALQSLVERYGCIAGYPDRTYRGNRSLSRYEFAAGLNACMDRISELIAAGTSDLVKKEDLATLQKLQEQFAAELATLRGRVDALEARTAKLEAQQFSTTTKLFGQAILGVQGRTADQIELAGFKFEDDASNINVITNVQLSLLTQFSPRSILLTGLQAGDGGTSGSRILTNDVALSYEGDTNNTVQLSDLTYRHLIGNNFAVVVGSTGVNMVNVFRGANRVESAGFGPLSRFAQRNPIINIGNGRAGAGFDWQIGPRLSFQAVYSSSLPEDPDRGGLFGGDNGSTTVGGQLTFTPIDTLDIALAYANAYSKSGFLGTGVGDDQLALSNNPNLTVPLKTNAVGATISWRLSPRFTLGGWAGYTNSTIPGESGEVETINWMAFLNFPDLFGRGNLGGIYVGQPPKITNSDFAVGRNVPNFVSEGGIGEEGGQPDTTTHVEAFYRYRVNDNISITPGVIVIFNPRHNADNDTITIGAIRTTFSF